MAAGLLVVGGSAAWGDPDDGEGSIGDERLHLNADVITSSGITMGGSGDFAVKAELFLPPMSGRAHALAQSTAAVADATGILDFRPRPTDPLPGVRDIRGELFAEYSPPAVITAASHESEERAALWNIVIVVSAVPLILLALWLGRKTASRRQSHHDRSAH